MFNHTKPITCLQAQIRMVFENDFVLQNCHLLLLLVMANQYTQETLS